MPACSCSERHRLLPHHLPAGSNERPRQWFVTRRNYSVSAFNGYRRRWSDSSDIHCRVCGAYWRTAARFVIFLPDCKVFGTGANLPTVEAIPADVSRETKA